MRPVNLIPSNERRGDQAVSRTGPLAYGLIGALCLGLVGVSMLVLTGNEVSDHKAEIAKLQAEHVAAQARAEKLAAYTQFQAVRDSRTATISSLADSRFDWERVIRELSLVIPPNVWLTGMTATASPEVAVEGGAEVTGRDVTPGPALELSGCAPGHEAVAGFVSVLRDIDGVTRVGVPSSELPDQSIEGVAAAAPGPSTSQDCRTRDFIAQFDIVAAFDAAPVTGTAAAPVPAAPAPTAPAATPPAGTATAAPADSAPSTPVAAAGG